MLLIVTYRPEFEPPWIGRPYVTALTLNRLGEREIAAMIDRVTGNKALPESIRQDIIERTDGIPLFVEEMTKAVLEAESEDEARHTAATVPSSAVAVPASLHASLMARLDRLGPAKEVAQVGAAIGREFSHALLAAVTRKSEAELDSRLTVSLALDYCSGRASRRSQLICSNTHLCRTRPTAHYCVSRAVRCMPASPKQSKLNSLKSPRGSPNFLARHCTEAGLDRESGGLWGKAGQRSLTRSALAEAVEQLRRALAQIALLPSTPALRREQIKFQVALITPLYHVKGPATPETKAAAEQARALIERAEALGEPVEDPLLVLSALYGSWLAASNAFDGDAVGKVATQFLVLAKKQGTTVPLLAGHRLMGNSLLVTGSIAEARAHFDHAFALYEPTQHRPLAMRFGQDIGVATQCFRSKALWYLGFPEAALGDADQALNDAREMGQAATLMYALFFVSFVPIFCGHYTAADAQLGELVAFADERAPCSGKRTGMSLHGYALVSSGEPAEAVRMITTGTKAYRSTGGTFSCRSMCPIWLQPMQS